MAALISLLAICITATLQFVFPFVESNNGCVTADLIHRDSPLSPLYSPSETNSERFHKAYLRSVSRLNNHFNPKAASPEALQAPMVSSGGEYFINISIGTPRVELIGIADTASDLTWIQCKPCYKCYEQNPPIFDPKQSSTSRNITCQSESCLRLVKDRRCDTNGNTCQFYYSYADGSYTTGNVGTEVFVISSKTNPDQGTFPNIVYGCGNNNTGTFDEVGSGIVGLGGGPLSLISQITKSINGKFSYCLVPTSAEGNATSKINFGDIGLVPGKSKVVTVDLVDKQPTTYYHVTLEAISVGSKRVKYFTSNATDGEEGNMIIDSGTTFTFLDPQFYEKLAAVLERQVGSKRVDDPRGYASACFKVEKESDLPNITFHFGGAADLKLNTVNAFARLEEENLMCLNMLPVDSIGVFGNLSQMNFLIQFDLVERKVSFMPTDCAKC